MTPTGGRKSDSEMQERFFPMVRPVIPGLDYFGDWRPAPAPAATISTTSK